MGYIEPKTDWDPSDGVTDDDLNRIEGNTAFLKGAIDDALASHTAEDATNAHLAKNIGIEDEDGNFTASDVEGALSELFTSVSDGKDLVGTAITDVDPSVTVPTDPTFAELATAIGQIRTGKKWASGTIQSGSSNPYSITGLDFVPSLVIVIATGSPSNQKGNIFVADKTGIYYNGLTYNNKGLWGERDSSDNEAFFLDSVTWGANNVTVKISTLYAYKWYAFD
jgi:hypothetical protein